MDLEFVERFNGYRSPGVILGLKMVDIICKRFNGEPKGKRIIGIAETKMCLPDALQIAVQATVGNKNLIVYNYGKLALSIVLKESGLGYRVSLKKDAINVSERMRKFLLREGKLSQEETDQLIKDICNLDEKYFNVEKIRINLPPNEEQLEIEECCECGELQPRNFMLQIDDRLLCQVCGGKGYFYRE